MEEQQEKSVTENIKAELKGSVFSFSADNESGYEDCEPSDANDAINERTDHTGNLSSLRTDHTGDLSDVRTDHTGDLSDVTCSKYLEPDQEADSLIETTSALTIDSSITRYI